MSLAHLHLLLNHVPVLGTYFGLVCLLIALALRSAELRRIALVVFVLVGLLAVPVYLTGPAAERSVERLDDVAHDLVARHEILGQASLVLCLLLALLSGVALWLQERRGRATPVLGGTLLVVALAAGVVLGWTANVGGKIRRPEIRYDFRSDPAPDDVAARRPYQGSPKRSAAG